jgi:hypothetical protein
MSVQHRGALQTFRAVYVLTIDDDAKIKRIEVFFDDQAQVDRFFSMMGN